MHVHRPEGSQTALLAVGNIYRWFLSIRTIWTMCMCVDRCCRPPRYRPRTISLGGTHDRTNKATYSPHRYLLSRDMAYKVKVRASRLHLWRVDPYPTSANSRLGLHLMRKVTYEVVRYKGGWVYRANGGRSEPFRTRRKAQTAAKLAASKQAKAAESAQSPFREARVAHQPRATER
jgi:hypothetical protein